MMLVFVLGAALSFAAFVGDDPQTMLKQLPFWAPAAVLMALAIGREPSVIFLSLFILPTLVLGIACLFKRISPTPFLVFALSDIVLGAAFSIYQSKTALWTLPEVNGWGPAAGICAGAAVIRLAGCTALGDTREGGLASLGWWQGALLAYWAGSQGVIALVAGGVLLWLIGAFYNQSTMVGLTLAGGSLAIAAGLGAGLFGVVSMAVAGIALGLGDRTSAVWAVGILPLSLVATLPVPTGDFLVGPALIFPGVMAVLAAVLGTLKPEPNRMAALPGAAGVVAFAYIGAIAEASIPPDVPTISALGGIPVPAAGAMWLVLGAVIAFGAAAGLTRSNQGYRPGFQQKLEPLKRTSQFDDITLKLIPPVGWFVFGVAILVAVRLFLAGFRTGFL